VITKDQRTASQECQAIADWLTPDDYSLQQHRDIFDRHEEGTGEWLLNSDEFQNWLIGINPTLFCPGMPGAGKTIIASTVIEHLWIKFENDPSIGVAFLYCNYKRHQNQKPKDLLAALLKQLVQEQFSLPEKVHSLYKRCNNRRIRPSFQEILEALHAIVSGYSRTFIIVDALDECQVPDGGRDKFIYAVLDLQAKTGANLFATSRHIPGILEIFQGSILLEVRASDEDVRRYVEGYISQLPTSVARSPALQEEIKTEIVKAVDGMYVVSYVLNEACSPSLGSCLLNFVLSP
jgi:hypothetical protein